VISDEKQVTRVPRNCSTTPVRLGPQLLNAVLFAILLSGCAGGRHFQAIPAEGPSPAPRYLELYSEVQTATLHFPAGVYTLNAVDKIGYYYGAPRKIAEHLGAGSTWHDGGIFVSKRNPGKLRGYVYRAGALTHVGNFSGTKHQLHD
jgi:hypothetical protein